MTEAVTCPACGWRRGTYGPEFRHGPKFIPRRPWRRRPYWKCTWCNYRWPAATDIHRGGAP